MLAAALTHGVGKQCNATFNSRSDIFHFNIARRFFLVAIEQNIDTAFLIAVANFGFDVVIVR